MSRSEQTGAGTITEIPALVTPAEVARLLGVSKRTVYDWIAAGRLPAVRPYPRTTRIPADAVSALYRGATHPLAQESAAAPRTKATAAPRGEAPQAQGPGPARPDLSSVLWDTDPDSLDEQRDAAFVIGRVLEAGSAEQLAWVFKRYPAGSVRTVAADTRRLAATASSAWTAILRGSR